MTGLLFAVSPFSDNFALSLSFVVKYIIMQD